MRLKNILYYMDYIHSTVQKFIAFKVINLYSFIYSDIYLVIQVIGGPSNHLISPHIVLLVQPGPGLLINPK